MSFPKSNNIIGIALLQFYCIATLFHYGNQMTYWVAQVCLMHRKFNQFTLVMPFPFRLVKGPGWANKTDISSE